MKATFFATNDQGRDFVMGDLHGHLADLENALSEIGFDPERDRLFSVGDLIDRGPASARCLELVTRPWFHACLGNHEQMMLDALAAGPTSQEAALWLSNGGEWAFSEDWDQLTAHAETLAKYLHSAIELTTPEGQVGIIHAEVPEHDWQPVRTGALSAEQWREAIWGRQTIRQVARDPDHRPVVQGIDQVAVGHTPVGQPIHVGNMHFLDTGVFLETGHLTLLPIETLW